MWIFSKLGFFSIVKDTKTPGCFLIRARCREDITEMRTVLRASRVVTSEIISTPEADYPFRIRVFQAGVERMLAIHAGTIDYPNFKSMVHNVFGAVRAHMYHEVWAAMLRLNPPMRRRKSAREHVRAGLGNTVLDRMPKR